ncbi:MAG: tetratricopeptide repeat protein [Planctomycetes bacterium]|nr:tetratricopeptide repeat protein [Planctomycetota bacterium]
MDAPVRRSSSLALLLALSGASALVDEVAWVRILTLLLGAGAPAVGTVLAVFFLGMAGGARLAGSRAPLSGDPLRAYAILEIGIGAFAVATPVLASLAESIYLGLGAGGLLPRVLVASLLLLPPTLAMGATLPFALRAAPRDDARAGSLLYGANTLGGVAGCLLAGFLLLENLGLRGTLLASAGGNAVAAAGALLLRRGAPPLPAPAPGPPARDPRLSLPLLLGAGAGFLAVAAEVLYTRLLSLVLGGTVFAFAAMLACFLAGIALGAAASGALLPRIRRPEPLFAALSSASALALLLSPSVLLHVSGSFAVGHEAWSGFGEVMARSFLACAAVLLPVGFLSGAGFAVLLRLATGAEERPGSGAAGRLYAWNTFGSVLGSIVGTFALLPLAVRGGGLAWLAGGQALLAAASSTLDGAWRRALVLLLFLPLAAFLPLRPDLSTLRLAISVADDARYGPKEAVRRLAVDGPGASVTVSEGEWGRTLRVNGKVVASTAFIDARNQYLLGHLPALMHPGPRTGLVVGLGTGMTAGALSVHPGIQVDLVELASEVVPAAREFGEWNHGVLDRGNVRLLLDDGRHFLLSTDRRFDVITSDPMHPWVRGGGSLYSLDYFRRIRARLAPGGVAAHWLPLYEMRPEEMRSILATFAAAFDHVALWIAFQDAILLGSEVPLLPRPEELARRMRAPEVLRDLAAVRLAEPDRLLALLVALDEDLRDLGRGGTIVTDDRQTLEFRAARSQNSLTIGRNLLDLAAVRDRTFGRLRAAIPDAARAFLLERVFRSTTATFRAYGALAEDSLRDAATAIVESWVEDPDGPGIPWGRFLPNLSAAFAGETEGAFLGAYGRGVLLWQEAKARRGRPEGGRSLSGQAERVFATAARSAPAGKPAVAALRERSKVLGDLGRYEECLGEAESALRLEPGLPVLHRVRAIALLGLGRGEDSLRAVEEAASLDGGSADTWSLRGSVLAALGRREDAAAAYREALARDPRDAPARAFLAR